MVKQLFKYLCISVGQCCHFGLSDCDGWKDDTMEDPYLWICVCLTPCVIMQPCDASIHSFIHSSTNSFTSSYPQLYLTGSMRNKLFQPFISYSSQALLLSPSRGIPRYSVVNEMYIFHPGASDLTPPSPSSWTFQEKANILTKLPAVLE